MTANNSGRPPSTPPFTPRERPQDTAPSMPSDETLTAFIDGELSEEEHRRLTELMERFPAVADRVAFLSRATLPYPDAFAPLLDEAPRGDLQRMLDGIPSPSARPAEAGWSRRRLFGALAASLAVGVLGDRMWLATARDGSAINADTNAVANADTDGDGDRHWHGVVAQYMALYTPETLGDGTPGREAQAAQLAVLNRRLGLSLTPDTVALPGAGFRRAQLLAYDGQPLAQITYLVPESGPLALCILRRAGTPSGIVEERRLGMNIAFWSAPGHTALLIGRMPPRRLSALAAGARTQLRMI